MTLTLNMSAHWATPGDGERNVGKDIRSRARLRYPLGRHLACAFARLMSAVWWQTSIIRMALDRAINRIDHIERTPRRASVLHIPGLYIKRENSA